MIYQKNLIKLDIHPDIYVYKAYYLPEICDVLYALLSSEINWQQHNVVVYGKVYHQPRLCSFIGDDGLSYTYSKLTLLSESWSKTILKIKQDLFSDFGLTFNSVLANFYRDGNDSNGWHADNESELGKNPTLVSLSFGGSRPLHIRCQKSTTKLLLEKGDLLLFTGRSQEETQHTLPKSKRFTDPRINLTYRTIV